MVITSEKSSTPYNPGIVIVSGDYVGSATEKELSRIMGESTGHIADAFESGENVKGWLITRSHNDGCLYSDDNLMVWVDGYISDIQGLKLESNSIKHPALSIATLYKNNKRISFLDHLRGSYSFLLMERDTGTFNFVVDRRGSRPYFFSSLNGRSLFLCPDIKLFVESNKGKCKVDYASACEFISSGRFYGRTTLFNGVSKLGQAKIITANNRGFKIKKYWRLSFDEQIDVNDKTGLIENFDAVFRKAVKRTLSATNNPFLFLSGGIDSRIILAYLLDESEKIPVVSFGMDRGPEDDCGISEAVASELNLDLLKYELVIDDLERYAEQVVEWTGSVVEVIDAPSLVTMWKDLGVRFDTFINGDECFGWKPHVDSYEKALNSNVIYRMKQVARLSKWLKKKYKTDIIKRIDYDLDTLIRDNKLDNPDDTKDLLYYKERLYNEVNAFTAPKLKTFEQARPLIDEDVIDFISKLPAAYRCEKKLYRTVLQYKFPELLSKGFASRGSLPRPADYRELFSRSAKIGSFIKDELIEGINEDLGEMFDRDHLRKDIGSILSEDKLTPLNHWAKLPGLWRMRSIQAENVTAPITLMLRILQLSIYLNKIQNSTL